MPRLGSKKSRNGCIQCKARRVKCDEGRPCANCSRHNADCSLLHDTPPAHRPREASTSSPRPSMKNPASPAPSSSTLYQDVPPPPIGENITGGWLDDLELMHHWYQNTAHAYLTIPGVDAAKKVWGYTVPQEAFKHKFLMHSILAFAAHHLAYLHPARSKHYRLLGSTHQSAGITGLNEAISVIGVCPETSHALFASASLTTINAFADTEHNLNTLVDILALCRGMNTVVRQTEDFISKGLFAAILRWATDPPKTPPVLSAVLVDIQTLAVSWEADHPMETNSPVDCLREALLNGIENSAHPALRCVMVWPMQLDVKYLEVLRERSDPLIISLFRHYCRILEYAGTEWWFFQGWRNISQQFLLI